MREGRAAGVDEARADALMDLIHSRATGSFVVQLAVPAAELDRSGRSASVTQGPRRFGTSVPGGRVNGDREADDVVTVTGFGMSGPTQVRRAWVESLSQVTAREVTARRVPAREVTGGEPSRPGARREVVACHAESGALVAIEDPVATRRGRATVSHAYRPPPALVELSKPGTGGAGFLGAS
ncbi:hypothetical protein BJ986_002596 [Phycicoccus badiiscoriae]|uniref:Uncharacterized protein n=1 Tax=Pedococcus badiiscoriae TaxID=642776 RepID=A0A852WH59_9MICO|nr:hypothetical protein [Pedococcus badiiscoriae]NYG08109.1 hypothetical protein [Pedococcus badiiscoriae]